MSSGKFKNQSHRDDYITIILRKGEVLTEKEKKRIIRNLPILKAWKEYQQRLPDGFTKRELINLSNAFIEGACAQKKIMDLNREN